MNKFQHVIEAIEAEVKEDRELYEWTKNVFSGAKAVETMAVVQKNIDAGVEAIAILTKAESEPELEWFHGYFEDGTGATRNASRESAEWRVENYGGYVLSRPKPEPFTVVAGKGRLQEED